MVFWRRRDAQVYDLIVEVPRADTAPRRLQRFACFVQSNLPLPAFRVRLDGVEQAISRHDLGDPNAPVDRRHTAYVHFHTEIAAPPRRARHELEVCGDGGPIARRAIRAGPPEDRAGPLLIVPHIPKTAGTSLRLALEALPALRLLPLYEAPQYIAPAACAALSAAAFDDLDVVFGHFAYGLHRGTRRPCRYITLLRDPAELLKSTYLFHKYVLDAPGFRDCGTLADAVDAVGEGLDNIQTRFVAGKAAGGLVNEADLATAIANMERDFAYVGTVERMDASLRAIAAHLGVPLGHQTVNATPPSPEGERLTRDDVIAALGPCLVYDMRLYAHARALFADGARAVGATR